MADRSLFITWRGVVHGREERAMENFNEAVGYYGRLQQEGKIERFSVSILSPNGAIQGYMQLEGSAQQLDAVRADKEFHRLIISAELIAEDVRVMDGYVNEGVATQMAMFGEAIQKVPQMA